MKIAGASGERELPVEKFFVAPADGNAREIALQPNEILTEIIVPAAAGSRNATYEMRQKEAMDWPLATASVALKGKETRIVLGHVGPVPVRAAAAEQLVAGKTITPELAEQAGKAAVEGAQPLSGNAYKVQLAQTAVKRALLEAGRPRAAAATKGAL